MADGAAKIIDGKIYAERLRARVAEEVTRLKAEHGLDLLIVDYLQLMAGRGRIESRQQEVSQISRDLKGLAKELDIPVVALSQLSRAPEAASADPWASRGGGRTATHWGRRARP